jgi:hypothetical protein
MPYKVWFDIFPIDSSSALDAVNMASGDLNQSISFLYRVFPKKGISLKINQGKYLLKRVCIFKNGDGLKSPNSPGFFRIYTRSYFFSTARTMGLAI